MTNKKTMVLYHDYLDTIFSELSCEEIGELIKAAILYDRDGVTTDFQDRTVRMAYKRIMADCDLNNEKYENACRKNRENGKKGGRPPKNPTGYTETQQNPMGYFETQANPDKPYNDSDVDNEIENDVEKDMDNDNDFIRVWNTYPKHMDKLSAWQVWCTIQPDKKLVDKMVSTIEEFKYSDEWRKENGQYIPYLYKWLSRRQWNDEVPKAVEIMY